MESSGFWGYCDRPNYRAGDLCKFYVTCPQECTYDYKLVRLFSGDLNPAGPQYRETLVQTRGASGSRRGFKQRTQLGGFIRVRDPMSRLAAQQGLTVQLLIWPTLVNGRRGVLSRWDEGRSIGWAITVENGHVGITVGDGSSCSSVYCTKPVVPETWYEIIARIDVRSSRLSISQRPHITSVNSRFGPIVDYEGSSANTASLAIVPGQPDVPLMIGGLSEIDSAGTDWMVSGFYGKIERPRLFGASVSDESLLSGYASDVDALAAWDFSNGITSTGIHNDDIVDVSNHGFGGRCVNQPDRGMTGHKWRGIEENFAHAPEQYGAIWFHGDSLDDCRWIDPLEIQLPQDLPSGVYALVLELNGSSDRVTFFVRPAGRSTSKAALLMPTYSYVSYGNSRVRLSESGGERTMASTSTVESRDVELSVGREFGPSIYDNHADGRGSFYASWRRPILGMRPDYRHEFGSLWQLPADLYLVDWLDRKGIQVDIITDHDLVEEGVACLAPYNVVINPTHSEYYSRQMLEAWETYLSLGGAPCTSVEMAFTG